MKHLMSLIKKAPKIMEIVGKALTNSYQTIGIFGG